MPSAKPLFVSTFILLWSEVLLADTLPTCRSEDFKYSFTECDELGGRYRVSVPRSPSFCVGGAPNAAIRVEQCFTSCDAGHFFNSTALSCQKCQPGSYSLGGGVRLESFKSNALPNGFHINTQTINSSGTCSGWKVVSNYFESVANSSADGCVSKISYTVRIVKRGKLSFKYQYLVPEDMTNAILLTFQYHNYDDSGSQDSTVPEDSEVNTKFLPVTNEPQKWKEYQIDLRKPGLYVFMWRSVLIGRSRGFFQNTVTGSYWLSGRTGSHSDTGFVRLKSVSVDGVAYASECTPCESGTYSNVLGASTCAPCPPNTESPGEGAQKCQNCDSRMKYAPKGSEHCLDKPICGHNDYYSIEANCNLALKSREVHYKWIEPVICRDQYNILPKPHKQYCNETLEDLRRMDSCNLGQELTIDKICQFCNDNQYRDHTIDKCSSCPPRTSPLYALSYKVWHSGQQDDNSLPDFLNTECVRTDDEYEYDCDATNVWFSGPFTKNYIRTGASAPLGAYLFLSLTVPGFRQQTGGELVFSFEIECDSGDYCLLILMETKRNARLTQQTNIIKEWNQSVGIQSYRHIIPQNISISFSWIFQRNHSYQSNAKIYEITLTNTIVGSAIKCNPCPHSNDAYCVPCPFGRYYDTSVSNLTENTHQLERREVKRRLLDTGIIAKCKQCPKNSIINSSLAFPIGVKESCIQCGPGLIDYKGISCYSNCQLDIDGDKFDLSRLKQPLIYRGGLLFTAGGTKYYHLFNITLCGSPDFKAVCLNNITTFDASDAGLEDYSIRSMICRSTIIPDGNQTMSAQSVSLGDKLIGISRSTTYRNITVHPEFQRTNSDLHLYYLTSLPTAACPNGRRLTLTISCAPELEQDLQISTPKACSDGTCDGCTFHLLVKTRTSAACRLCQPSDYDIVVGECVDGLQKIHYVNPRGCIISADGKNKVEPRHCSVIPRQVQFGIALVSAIGVLLLVLVFHFWKKNRSLEYKYCKLIEGNEKSAECCAEEEDEDDNDNDDQVMIHPKKPKEVYEEGYETIQLTKHSDRNTKLI